MATKEFTKKGITIIFYQKELDDKFSFRIKGNEELTEALLSKVSTKRVKEKDIERYCLPALWKILQDELQGTIILDENQNATQQLNEYCQKKWGKNPIFEQTDIIGASHSPTVFYSLELPDGSKYEANGRNKQTAKNKCSILALNDRLVKI